MGHGAFVRRIPCRNADATGLEALINREWLVTNGLGGYACGTLAGVPTRRYHGTLIAALPAPYGRTFLLGPLSEHVRLPNGVTYYFGGSEFTGGRLQVEGNAQLDEFRLENGLPVWRYQLEDYVLEKRVVMPHRHNTVLVSYHLVEGDGVARLKIRPAVHFRSHDAPVNTPLPAPFRVSVIDGRIELAAHNGESMPLRMLLYGERRAFTVEGAVIGELLFRIEESRGYDFSGELYAPGYFRADLRRDTSVTFQASCESWDKIQALPAADAWKAERDRRARLLAQAPAAAREGLGAELVLAADQFVITPAAMRVEEASRIRAAGDEPRTVIAGYHWFTDWGRDTMISLEGLTLATGRPVEGGYLLRTFAHHVRDGLIPNLFPEGESQGMYHTADATLWFFQALHRYLEITGDRNTLRLLLPKLRAIVDAHLRGTHFNIHVDPSDGLLHQGAEGYQLTWMDAKVGDWVVTPRRGKAVEINALWYNALCLMQAWHRGEDDADAANALDDLVRKVRTSFNARFWNDRTGHLYDVVDGEQGDDAACRPNQVLAVSLPHAVLDPARWQAVVHVVRDRLLTPVGLRSLAPGHRDYKEWYQGDLRSRDAAYHQGTVWAWLIGPFVDAWLKVHPEDKAGARRFLDGFEHHLNEACVGSISEIFDAEAPFTPRGCVAQAWSVAEVLRAWLKTAPSEELSLPPSG